MAVESLIINLHVSMDPGRDRPRDRCDEFKGLMETSVDVICLKKAICSGNIWDQHKTSLGKINTDIL